MLHIQNLDLWLGPLEFSVGMGGGGSNPREISSLINVDIYICVCIERERSENNVHTKREMYSKRDRAKSRGVCLSAWFAPLFKGNFAAWPAALPPILAVYLRRLFSQKFKNVQSDWSYFLLTR